ncbi:MAG TPA: L-threonylcarbamoyladenylate synthase, partial [Pararhizobium sp.]|nr:L-threonylcarbamoyladenylate synthase [Pararhizobium sp.]
MVEIISIKDDRERALEQGRGVLAAGYPLAMPTETVYGLAADATNPEAIARIYEVKGRPQFNPLICHVADPAMAERLAVFDPLSLKLAERFWPGPLTLVLPLASASPIHPLATAGLDSVGLRMPAGFARELIAAFGRPLAAPSANTSGKVSPTTAQHVADDLGEKLPLILDAGPARVGVESTIVKIIDGVGHLLRPGGVPAEEIEAVLGAPVKRRKAGSAIESPGMMASHYAPAAAVRLNATSVQPGEALIRFGNAALPGEEKARAVFELSPSGDLREAAARLFDTLKLADGPSAIA